MVMGIGVLDANSDRVSRAQRRVDLICAHFPHDHRSIAHPTIMKIIGWVVDDNGGEPIRKNIPQPKPSCTHHRGGVRMSFSAGGGRSRCLRVGEAGSNVTIIRDDWGIAHVYGKTDANVVFGGIYSQAEDDFNQG